MSMSKRKKAIQKVVKLLNLATSTNMSESIMALRHAESLIRQYQVAQRELPILQLCDRSMLYRVSWGGIAPRYTKESVVRPSSEGSVYQRRFSEKSSDPARAYESARTILDDMEMTNVDSSVSIKEAEKFDIDRKVCGDNTQTSFEVESSGFAGESEMTSNVSNDDSLESPAVKVSGESQEKFSFHDNVSANFTSNDNVINAAKAFRPEGNQFAEALKSQYATSDPAVPFSEDIYWSKMCEKLADFDEAKIQTEIEALNAQLLIAQQNLHAKKQRRIKHEQDEVQERAKRARIEQSFEEAIERAFQARARSYEAWEESCSQLRMVRLREEQEASQGYEVIDQALFKNKEAYKQHLQRKEDYRAAKIMHDLRRHLALVVSADVDAATSYDKVIAIMGDNGLSLKDLEFSDIQNKSLFIRLLERESALISNIHEREAHTEKMLDKFLTSSMAKKHTRASENPIQHIQRLLIAASEGGQFETQKNLEQVIYLMESNGVGVRDIGYGFIKKYSVFIRLINWEAEKITSLPEREKFTAQILEEYIQYSVQKPKAGKDHKVGR